MVLLLSLEALHEAKPSVLIGSGPKTKVPISGGLVDETEQSVHACEKDVQILGDSTYIDSVMHSSGGSNHKIFYRLGLALALMDSLDTVINVLNHRSIYLPIYSPIYLSIFIPSYLCLVKEVLLRKPCQRCVGSDEASHVCLGEGSGVGDRRLVHKERPAEVHNLVPDVGDAHGGDCHVKLLQHNRGGNA